MGWTPPSRSSTAWPAWRAAKAISPPFRGGRRFRWWVCWWVFYVFFYGFLMVFGWFLEFLMAFEGFWMVFGLLVNVFWGETMNNSWNNHETTWTPMRIFGGNDQSWPVVTPVADGSHMVAMVEDSEVMGGEDPWNCLRWIPILNPKYRWSERMLPLNFIGWSSFSLHNLPLSHPCLQSQAALSSLASLLKVPWLQGQCDFNVRKSSGALKIAKLVSSYNNYQ